MESLKLLNFKSLFILFALLTPLLIFAQNDELVKEEQKTKEIANKYVYQGNELLASDEFVSAEKEFRKAISKEGSNVAGNYNLGNSYYKKGNFDEALYRQSEAAKIATTKADKHRAFHNIGNILMQKKQCKEAVEAFKNALRNDPTDNESRYNFAMAKQCAEEQKDQQNDENDKDKDKEEEKKDDQKEGENEEKDDQKDKGDSDNKEGEDDKEKDGEPEDNKEGDQGKDKQEQPQQPKPQPGQLSPQQIKSLLEAMNNQEQKVQEKLNAEKQKGEKKKNEKDW